MTAAATRACWHSGPHCLALGDAVTALSPTFAVLLVGKAVIAATGGGAHRAGRLLARDPELRGRHPRRALALISAQLGLGGVIGGLGAGLMATNASWRAWFWVEVAIGIVLIVMMRRHFAERLHPRVAEFDLPGAVLSFVGLALIVLGFIQASAFGFVQSRQDFHLFGVKLLGQGGISPTLPMIALGLLTLVRVRVRRAPADRPRQGAARPPLGARRTGGASAGGSRSR